MMCMGDEEQLHGMMILIFLVLTVAVVLHLFQRYMIGV